MFRNSNLSLEGWELLARALDKIIADCMGGELYNALLGHLKGGTIIIELDPASNDSAFSYHYGQGNAKITWGIKDNSPSNSLFHEMLHVYKTYQNDYSPSSMNEEIEVRMAQYLYLTRRPEFTENSQLAEQYKLGKINNRLVTMTYFMDSKGSLIDPLYNEGLQNCAINMGKILKESYAVDGSYPYAHFNWDDRKIGIDNFSSIKKLSKKC